MSFHFFKKARRRELAAAEFPKPWLAFLKELPYYCILPENDQCELQQHIQIFLAEKSFMGAQGLEVTDQMRISVAAHACVLLLHRETDYFPRLDTIVLYPSSFTSEIRESAGDGVVLTSQVARVGESNTNTGTVVLAWDRVHNDTKQLSGDKDIIFHEFAHQLDSEDGITDGAPKLSSAASYGAWARVFNQEYQELDATIAHHRATWIDSYAATNPAEFFAVVTEAFFKKPRRVQQHSPELYRQLSAFFRQDPAVLKI